MELTSFYFEKIRIKNFLSFYGNQEVNFSGFTAVTCCYSRGKEDLVAAIEFVLGKNLKKIHGGTPDKLINKVFLEKCESRNEMECSVEITLKSHSEEKMKLCKAVKNGDFVYKVDDKIISGSFYESLLEILNINIKRKTVILRKSFFHFLVWGPSNHFEIFISKLLRINSRLEEWKKMREDIENLEKFEQINLFEEMKKTHGTVDKFVQNFKYFLKRRDSFGGCSNGICPFSKNLHHPEQHENGGDFVNVESLENQINSSVEILKGLQMRESKLSSELYNLELKISPGKPEERMRILKKKIKNFEILLSSFWAQMKEFENELKTKGNEISFNLATLSDLEELYYLRNRLTKYGRFIDYIQPFEFMDVLKDVIGKSALYGNLCDDFETAKSCLEHLKGIKYEKREEFIIFKNYQPQFKDLLLGSGEKGIKIRNIREFQIFLCKLKECGFMEKLPVIHINKREFDLELEEGRELKNVLILFVKSRLFLGSDGTMSYTGEINGDFESKSLVKTVEQSLIQQELMYEEYRDLFFQRLITIQNINVLENDINYFKFHYKKRNNGRPKDDKTGPELSGIYDEYKSYFIEHERELENAEKQWKQYRKFCSTEEEEELATLDDGRRLKMEEASAALNEIENEKEKVSVELANLRKKLRVATAFSHKIWFPPIKKYVLVEHREKIRNLYYDIEFKKLNNIMSKEEVEEFEGWKEWRKSTINSLKKTTDNFGKLLKNSKINLDNLTEERTKMFSHLVEHCNLNLSPAANSILDTSFPFLKLVMNHSRYGLELVSSFTGSKLDTIEITHFNSFLKFIAALLLFLEIANYEQVPILFVDNLQEFLPPYKDTFEAVLDESVLNRVVSSHTNTNFQIITRIAQYLHFFIKKNGARANIKETYNSGERGPVQIIYFTSEDLVHAADHHIWIRRMFLPDELISSVCNSYSVMEEIQFE